MTDLKNILTGENLSYQWFINTLKDILAKIFAFVGVESGWKTETEDAE